MNVSDFKKSKFLKRDDVGEGKMVTIKSVTEENVAMEGADPEMKPCIYFEELSKPLVVNQTNAESIGDITGIHHNVESGWVGKQIVLYDDPKVMFGGKKVGGIRVKAKLDLPF